MREIRSAAEDELPEFYRLAARQLGLPMSMFGGMSPEWTLAAFEDGQIATTYRSLSSRPHA